MTTSTPFDNAVNDYVSSLTNEQRKMLLSTILNSRAQEHWHWFEDVIDRYHLRDSNSAVVRDINERIDSDPYKINTLLWGGVGNAEPIYEAKTLLDAVRKVLKEQAGA